MVPTFSNSFASFFENSSIASYQKESFEDDYEEITPSVFGSPPTESQVTLSTSDSTASSAKTPATQPPQNLDYLGAASPQVSDIAHNTDAEIITTITQMFTTIQAT